MKNIRQVTLLSAVTLTCIFAGKSYASAQIDTALVAAGDPIEVVPLQKFDFGAPNPNADNSKIAQPIDYLKTASAEEIQQARIEATILNENSNYRIMALSEDDAEYAVGQIPYQEDVTSSGGRMYNVPIMITPLAGFAPQISLQYNSQAGNGLAGYGWNIGGLSSITISNKNLYYNGKVAPANINDLDAVYSLDGLPLVLNDDTASEYLLETAKGHIIVQQRLSGDFIRYFTALYPDGSKAIYGMTSNTSAKAVYPITLWEDKFGNQIIYDYNCTNSDYRISTILFKHNNNNIDIGKLTFNYSSRKDYHTRYRAGQASYQSSILKSITSESDGKNLCTYQLDHEFKDGVNLLTSIGCTNASGEQLRPLAFTYGNTNDYASSSVNDFSKSDFLFLSTYFSSSSDVKFFYHRGKYMPDSYNDGVMILPAFSTYDIVATKTTGIWPFKKEHNLFGSRYAAEQVVLVAPRLSYLSDVDNSITVGSGFQCINAADIDGDGVDEIVKVNFNGTSTGSSTTNLMITVYGYESSTGAISQKKTFNVAVNGIVTDGDFVSPICRCYHFGNFKGDGKTQLLTISYNEDPFGNSRTSYASLIDLSSGYEISESSFLSLGTKDELFCIDLDGDGRTEICHATASGLNVYNLKGSTFSLTKTAKGITSSTLSSNDYYFVDINADGYVDIARKPVGTSPYWYIYQYTGNMFAADIISLEQTAETDQYMFFDVNNDGFPDMVKRNGTSVDIYLNENGTFIYGNRITSQLSFAESTQFVPCNIMGYNTMSDFITIEDCYLNLYKFSQDLSSSRLLTKFTNSLGATTVNNYANMASSNYVYTIDADRIYSSANGYAKCRFPLQLLYNTQSYLTPSLSGADQVTDLWYTYFDACIHTKGLGFCGFGKVRTTDFRNITNKELVTIETRNPEKMGVTTRLVHGHRMTQDNPYDITDYTYDTHTTTYGKLNPRLIKVVHTDLLSTLKSTTSYVYDSYDYPTSIEVQRIVEGGALLKESQKIEYVHKTTSGNYCLGNIISDKRTKTVPLEIEATRPGINSEVDYNDEINAVTLNEPITSVDPIRPVDPIWPVDPIGPIDTASILEPGKPAVLARSLYWMEKQVYTYNEKMQPLTRIDSVGTSSSKMHQKLQTSWTYDSYGNVLTEMAAHYNVTEFIGKTYIYDSNGINLLSVTNELGQKTTFSDYNKFGKPSSQSDHKGRKTYYTYDDWGSLISKTSPDGTISSASAAWGGIGCYTVTESVTGKPKTIAHYDAAGREVRTGSQRYNMQWIFTDKVYGKNGQLQKVSLPFRSTTDATLWNTYEYDEYIRPVSYTQASGNITTWAYEGKTTTESKSGVWSIKTINSNGQVVKVQDAGGTINYSLRADGQPSKVTVDGSLSTTFEYDSYGRRTKIVDPSAGMQIDSIVFNSDGSSVSTHTNPNGSIITYTDKFGRTTKVERPGEYTTDYVYNPDGLLTFETSSNGTSKTYTYDNLDRVLTMTETVPDGKWLKKTFTYTSGSNVSTIAYESQNGAIATEGFAYANGTNIRIGVQEKHVRLINGENEFGQPTSVSTGSITRTYSYNAYGLPTRRTMGDVMDYSYSFDPLKGNLMSRTDNLRNQTETFGYDDLNRLVAIDDRMITYSANGNITSIDSVGDMTYGNSSRPYQVTSLTLEDDVVPSRVQDVTYTCYSRPSIMTEGGRSAAFTYNGDGSRVKMNVSDGATSVLSRYYIGNQYELDVTPLGTVERLYLGGDAYSAPAVYVREGSGAWTFYNIGRDYLGNITHIATYDGTLVEENSYDPWGRLRNPETKEVYALGTEPGLMLGRGYTGHEHLTWFGLINMNARLYDPVLGRFLSPDPFVQTPDFTQNFNRYSYCLNNPLVYVDENGEIAWFIPIITGVIGGVVNLFANINNVEGFWDGLSTFAVGFAAGALAVVSGGSSIGAAIGTGIATGAVTSFNNSMVAQTGANFAVEGDINWNNVWQSTISGAVAGGASGAVGSWASTANITINGVSSPLLNSAVTSTLSAGTGHIVGGTAYNLMSGQGFADAFNNSLQGIWKNILIGGVIGVGTTTATCLATGINPITGLNISAKDLHLDASVQRIQNGVSNPHRHDGTVFNNREGYLPQSNDPNYYHEYVHPTPGINGAGPQRIITGSRGEWYYTPDHYKTFIRFVP